MIAFSSLVTLARYLTFTPLLVTSNQELSTQKTIRLGSEPLRFYDTMDNLDRLKRLTETVIRRQNKSIKNLLDLELEVEMLHIDVRNLINSLHLLGDRQFLEHKIIENGIPEPRIYCTDECRNSTTLEVQNIQEDCDIYTLIRKAIELIPPEDHPQLDVNINRIEENGSLPVERDEPKSTTNLDDVSDQSKTQESPVSHLEDSLCSNGESANESVVVESKVEADDDSPKVSVLEPASDPVMPQTSWTDQEPASETPKESDNIDNPFSKRLEEFNKGRVTDILKRYSLYDEDDEDDEESE